MVLVCICFVEGIFGLRLVNDIYEKQQVSYQLQNTWADVSYDEDNVPENLWEDAFNAYDATFGRKVFTIHHPLSSTEDFNFLRNGATNIISVSRERICPERARRNKTLFIHVPKSGGESIEAAFKLIKNHELAPARRTEFFDETKRKDVFIFTVVRNPYSRMWSWFCFCIHGWQTRLPGPRTECQAAIDVISSEQDLTQNSVRQQFARWLTMLDTNRKRFEGYGPGKFNLRSQIVDWVVDPVTNVIIPDYFIRFEHYEEDFAAMCDCMGLHGTSLPHENDSQGQAGRNPKVPKKIHDFLATIPYTDAYVAESKAIVFRWFERDFELFKYSPQVQ